MPAPPADRPEFSPVCQKCDGRSPKCGPCSAAKRELDCVFPSRPENRDKRNALPKGKACRSCRSVSQILSISFPKPPPDPLFHSSLQEQEEGPSSPRLSHRLHLILFVSRNVMDSTRFAAPVPAPATASRAFTMKPTTFPASIRMLTKRTIPFRHPHTPPTGLVEPIGMTSPPRPPNPYPHHLKATAYSRHLQGYHPHQRSLAQCNSSAPWTSV